jgi:hypothetical protein
LFDNRTFQFSPIISALRCSTSPGILQDRRLLRLFLHDLVKAIPAVDARKLAVLEQRYPGEEDRAKRTKRSLTERSLTGTVSPTGGSSLRNRRGAP